MFRYGEWYDSLKHCTNWNELIQMWCAVELNTHTHTMSIQCMHPMINKWMSLFSYRLANAVCIKCSSLLCMQRLFPSDRIQLEHALLIHTLSRIPSAFCKSISLLFLFVAFKWFRELGFLQLARFLLSLEIIERCNSMHTHTHIIRAHIPNTHRSSQFWFIDKWTRESVQYQVLTVNRQMIVIYCNSSKYSKFDLLMWFFRSYKRIKQGNHCLFIPLFVGPLVGFKHDIYRSSCRCENICSKYS